MSSGQTRRFKNEYGRRRARKRVHHQSNLVIALIQLMITLAPIELVVEVVVIVGEGGIGVGKKVGVVGRGIGKVERGSGGIPSVVRAGGDTQAHPAQVLPMISELSLLDVFSIRI